MDDEVLFALSGMTSSKPLKTQVESLRQISEDPRRFDLLLTKQKHKLVIYGCIAGILTSRSVSEDGVATALTILLGIATRLSGDFFAQIPDSQTTQIAQKLVIGLIHCACSQSISISQQALHVLVELTNYDKPYAESIRSQVVQCNEFPHLVTVMDFIISSTMDAERKAFALELVEHLSFQRKEIAASLSSALIGHILSPRNLTHYSRTSLRCLTNLTNGIISAGTHAVESNGVELVMDLLQNRLSSQMDGQDLSNLSPEEFDLALFCLCFLGNLVELPQTNATGRFNPLHVDVLCQIYTMSLPVRVRNELQERSASEVVEADAKPDELIMAAHTCLVLGCLVRDSREIAERVLKLVPGGQTRGFSPMILMLEMFSKYQAEAGVLTQEGMNVLEQVARYLLDANNRLMLPPSSLLPVDRRRRIPMKPPVDVFQERSELATSRAPPQSLDSIFAPSTNDTDQRKATAPANGHSTASHSPTRSRNLNDPAPLPAKRSSPLRDKRL